MTVSAIGATNVSTLPAMHATHAPPPLTKTAALLGVSTDDLRAAQRSGTTLSDLAAQKGVSKDDLVASLTEDLQANAPQGAPALTEAQMTEMATNIAEGRRPGGPGGHGRPRAEDAGSTDRAQSNLSLLADALGIDSQTLLEQLRSGIDLSSLLSGQTGYGSSLLASLQGGVAVDETA